MPLCMGMRKAIDILPVGAVFVNSESRRPERRRTTVLGFGVLALGRRSRRVTDAPGSTAAIALLNDAVKKGGLLGGRAWFRTTPPSARMGRGQRECKGWERVIRPG